VTYPEVEWVLSVLQEMYDGSQVGSSSVGTATVGGGALDPYTLRTGDPVTLALVDRDDSEFLEGDIRSREGDLRDAVFVGASRADKNRSPAGTEYDHDVETIVAVRIEGMHYDEFGHVDPDGDKGVPFDRLEWLVQRPPLRRRSYPDVGPPRMQYHTLRIENEAPQSDDYSDYYRTDIDVRLDGYEDLPAP